MTMTSSPTASVVVSNRNLEVDWRAATADPALVGREYVRAMDAYLAVLRAGGRPIPYRLDEMADTMRMSCGDVAPPRVA
jgi:hypothetical protein